MVIARAVGYTVAATLGVLITAATMGLAVRVFWIVAG